LEQKVSGRFGWVCEPPTRALFPPIFDIDFKAYGKAHPCLRTIGQSEFNYQGIMVGSSYFDRERFNEFQPSIVDVVDIMAKDGGSIVFAKSHRLQI